MKTIIAKTTRVIAASLFVICLICYIRHQCMVEDFKEFNQMYQIAVFKNGKEALADFKGNILTIKMDRIFKNDRRDSLLVFIKDEKRGYLNLKSLKVEIPPVYDYAWRFDRETGLAAVCIKGKIGFIDAHGNLRIQPIYPFHYENLREDEGFIFSKGSCIVPINDKRGLINSKNETLLPATYNDISELSINNQYRIVRSGDQYGLYNEKTRLFAIPLGKSQLSFIDSGIVVLEIEPIPNQYLLDWQLNKKKTIFDVVEHLTKEDFKNSGRDTDDDDLPKQAPSGFSKYAINSKYGILDDSTGKLLCPPVFDDIEYYSKGIFKATVGDYEFLVDRNGKAVNK